MDSTLWSPQAHEDTVRRRVASRAKRFGERDVPEEVLAASLAAPANTLRALTPHVDFIARIRNESGDPELEALETVDTSGDWAAIALRFGGAHGMDPGLERESSAPNLRGGAVDVLRAWSGRVPERDVEVLAKFE